eukprot:gene3577-5100_t
MTQFPARHTIPPGLVTLASLRSAPPASLCLTGCPARSNNIPNASPPPPVSRMDYPVESLAENLVLGQLEHLRTDLREYARGIRGHLRVHANTTALGEFLPPVLRAFPCPRWASCNTSRPASSLRWGCGCTTRPFSPRGWWVLFLSGPR